MLFTRIVSCLAFVLTLGILAVAKPVELEERASLASVEGVIDSLKSKTDSILPQIQSAAQKPGASSATLTPLVNELVSAIKSAQNSLNSNGVARLKSRQSQDVVANKAATVIKDIAGTIKIIPIGFPGLGGLIVSLDLALFGLLTTLNIVVVGVGVLVGGLLTGVAGLLSGLGLGLTLGLLGLL